jgi:hypothetical protein
MKKDIEYFKPTSGRLLGSLGLVLVFGLIGLLVADGLQGSEVVVVLGFACLGVVIWVALLRPRVGLSGEELLLRNPVSDVLIPLVAIESVVLRQVLAVRVGERRYMSAALGRTLRTLRTTTGINPQPAHNYCDFAEERIRQRMEDARALSGITLRSVEQLALAAGVRRSWAWPELVALVVTAGGVLVALVV